VKKDDLGGLRKHQKIKDGTIHIYIVPIHFRVPAEYEDSKSATFRRFGAEMTKIQPVLCLASIRGRIEGKNEESEEANR